MEIPRNKAGIREWKPKADIHNWEEDMVTRRDLGKIGLAAGFAGTFTRPAWAESAADIAVKAAQQYRGQTITIVWEAGLQSLDPLNFSGPKWKELTGIDVKVVEVPVAEMFTKIMQDFRSGAGAYDALNVIPAWMPDLVNAGALEELDAMVDKFSYRDELQKIAPTYRDNQMMVNGKIFGFPDDGDVFVMYYRTDVLGDPALQAAYKAKFGTDLHVGAVVHDEHITIVGEAVDLAIHHHLVIAVSGGDLLQFLAEGIFVDKRIEDFECTRIDQIGHPGRDHVQRVIGART